MGKPTSFTLHKDVNALLTDGKKFAEAMRLGDFTTAGDLLRERDEIIKRDKQAWVIAQNKHQEEMTGAPDLSEILGDLAGDEDAAALRAA